MEITGDVHFDVDIVARAIEALALGSECKEKTEDEHDGLPPNRADLNLDVHDLDVLRADIELDEAWVHRLVELAEARDKTNRPYKHSTRKKGRKRRSGDVSPSASLYVHCASSS